MQVLLPCLWKETDLPIALPGAFQSRATLSEARSEAALFIGFRGLFRKKYCRETADRARHGFLSRAKPALRRLKWIYS